MLHRFKILAIYRRYRLQTFHVFYNFVSQAGGPPRLYVTKVMDTKIQPRMHVIKLVSDPATLDKAVIPTPSCDTAL